MFHHTKPNGRILRSAICVIALCLMVSLSHAAELAEPITISSENGILDLLMIAKAAPIQTLSSTGWVYVVCKRPADGSEACPQPADTPNYYGGTLLHLEKGDTLRIHLVNQLPPVTDSKHALEPGHAFLTLNPTNIHTHGMLVSPHSPSADDPTYGDNIFVLTFNPLNGQAVVTPHVHSAVRYGSTDYEIKVPANHPSGLFWFHPHAHGLSLNQVSAGLGGIITVGKLTDYVCKNRACSDAVSKIGVHHIILKDLQVLPSGDMQSQEDPRFCAPAPSQGDAPRQGYCPGQDNSPSGGNNYTQGKWYFTLNGQPYPTIPIRSSGGEIWRIANVSGSATYDLSLWNPVQNRDMIVQVLSIDGVSVSPLAGMSDSQKKEVSGGKFDSEPCPDVEAAKPGTEEPLCTRRVHMMPSSRIELWVAYRDSNDSLASAPQGAFAVFRQNGYQTGPSGDNWPTVDLARVEFQGQFDNSIPKALAVNGEAVNMANPVHLAGDLLTANLRVAPDPNCKPLPPGHMRRMFYGVPTNNLSAFGLAYEEIDEKGNVVGEPATDVTTFDPMKPTVCVPLGPGNTPVTERWQIVNVATEDHNFHIHQVKFRVVTKDELAGTILPGQVLGKGVMLDNFPIAHATGTCGNNPPSDPSNPISDWRSGACISPPITVEIPFAIAGDFVYHCHILEHEDGGMMARIRVRPTP